MTVSCSICGKPVKVEDLKSIALNSDTIVKVCHIAQKRANI